VAEEQNQEAEGAAAEASANDAVQKKSDGAAAPAPGNQKLIFIFSILNTVVVVVIAVLFAMQYSKKSKEVGLNDIQEKPHAADDGHGEKKDDGHGGGGGDKKVLDPFIKETFTVNLKDSRGAHYAKVNVEIEVDDDFVREEVKRLIPRIRDFVVVTLSSKTYEQVESVDGREFLREDIRNKINGFLTRGQVKNVFFTEFIIQ